MTVSEMPQDRQICEQNLTQHESRNQLIEITPLQSRNIKTTH